MVQYFNRLTLCPLPNGHSINLNGTFSMFAQSIIAKLDIWLVWNESSNLRNMCHFMKNNSTYFVSRFLDLIWNCTFFWADKWYFAVCPCENNQSKNEDFCVQVVCINYIYSQEEKGSLMWNVLCSVLCLDITLYIISFDWHVFHGAPFLSLCFWLA